MRAAAVSTLAKFAATSQELLPNVLVLLQRFVTFISSRIFHKVGKFSSKKKKTLIHTYVALKDGLP